ncbi:sterol desaturase/sphingolipid hydroxylase (fatty acid hydroxylase superfamily) [Lewinella aquimaris]|uniref:Sterol desaturase/sphingolipid hydroxylase (Fatty acid hydroxylase superfamily) n=1 Tax=Neolewinella aquimaris TaxID=1835722 RepID=A0A840E452_9BACT|nr:sterol desaturase family protein [Neolewinella aquimaris]MBB4079961.1 sterol desaturase/sphingolipid hydroxylase (fatty acid hydroxylase superfamily) [Neolewinella aquimaris]
MKARTQKFKSNANESPPMFENKILNRLTQTHIATPIIIFFVYAIGLLWYTAANTDIPFLTVVLVFFAGILGFTFMEYAVHRWVYHPPHGASEAYKNATYKMHGMHHDYPKDKKRLAMPPLVAIILATSLLFLFELVLGQYSFSYLAGFVVGYALYLVVHYTVHIYAPPRNFLRALWVNHSIHHYSEDEVLFGVSQPLWDYVFGTMPRSDKDKRMAREIHR